MVTSDNVSTQHPAYVSKYIKSLLKVLFPNQWKLNQQDTATLLRSQERDKRIRVKSYLILIQ